MWAYNCICIEHLWVLRRMIAPGYLETEVGEELVFYSVSFCTF